VAWKNNGFVPGRDVSIQYRWAEGNYDRLPALAAELALPVDVILAQTPPAALAAKAATATIPIVFVVGIDPAIAGLVASYNRPGGNATGATMIMATLGQKRIEILPGRAADHVRTGVQPQDRQGTKHRHPGEPACPLRRGDRIRIDGG
jgi:ABC transporter substrate binding protein